MSRDRRIAYLIISLALAYPSWVILGLILWVSDAPSAIVLTAVLRIACLAAPLVFLKEVVNDYIASQSRAEQSPVARPGVADTAVRIEVGRENAVPVAPRAVLDGGLPASATLLAPPPPSGIAVPVPTPSSKGAKIVKAVWCFALVSVVGILIAATAFFAFLLYVFSNWTF